MKMKNTCSSICVKKFYLFGSKKYIVKKGFKMEDIIVNAIAWLIMVGVFNFIFSHETWNGDDCEMSEEEEAAYHYEFFHRR